MATDGAVRHDIHYQTVYNLTSYQIDAGIKAGYKRKSFSLLLDGGR